MKPTVATSLSTRTGDKDKTAEYVGRELANVVKQAREILNFEVTTKHSGESDGAGTDLVLWTSEEMPRNATWLVRIRVAAHPTTEQASSIGAAYDLRFTRTRYADGSVTVLGSDSSTQWESNAAFSATLATSGGSITLTVNDGSQAACKWVAVVSILESTTSD